MQEKDIKTSFIDEVKKLPLVVTPLVKYLTLRECFDLNKEFIDRELLKYGGILFRGFQLDNIHEFESIVQDFYGSALDYNDRATLRSRVQGKVFTATDYPPEQEILMHNESSFAATFPRKIFFYCIQAADKGGETPVADVRNVYNRIDPEIRKPFEEKGVLYVRNFTGGPFGFKWQDVYQTDDKSEMERFCNESDIQFEWIGDHKARTQQKRPATAKHPITKESLWINHATVLNVYAIEPKLQQMLLKFFKEEDLPNNTFYGDGTRIDKNLIELLKNAYSSESVAFPWQIGDMLMLDNMLVAHGRKPFSGKRKIVVAMAEPITWNELQP